MFFFNTTTQPSTSSFFFFNDTATTEIYTLSLHDALPISQSRHDVEQPQAAAGEVCPLPGGEHGGCFVGEQAGDRKSTRLNSSHLVISYAVFCLKKKKKTAIARAPYYENEGVCQSA